VTCELAATVLARCRHRIITASVSTRPPANRGLRLSPGEPRSVVLLMVGVGGDDDGISSLDSVSDDALAGALCQALGESCTSGTALVGDSDEARPEKRARVRERNLATLRPPVRMAAAALETAALWRSISMLHAALGPARAAGVGEKRLQRAEQLIERLEAFRKDSLATLQTAGTAGCDSLALVGRWLIVFDFDQTIAKDHIWAKHKNAPLDTIVIDDSTFVDLGSFRAFIDAVRARDHVVAIATFGRRVVVDKAMRHALGEEHGVVITTPADFPDPGHPAPSQPLPHGGEASMAPRCPEGSGFLGSKNRQLASLANELGVGASRILFLDDDINNTTEAAKGGVVTRHTPFGLRHEVLDEAARTIGLPATWAEALMP